MTPSEFREYWVPVRNRIVNDTMINLEAGDAFYASMRMAALFGLIVGSHSL